MLTFATQNHFHSLQSKVQVGRYFAFFEADLLRTSELSWLEHLLPAGTSSQLGQVVPLLSQRPVDLPGARHQGAPRVAFNSLVVSCDKPIYALARENVHLLVCDPAHPGRVFKSRLWCDQHLLQESTRQLDGRGMLALELHDLAAGNYRFEVSCESGLSPAAEFSVAEYQLVALLASLSEQSFNAGNLQVQLRVETFGIPVQGQLRLSLQSADQVSQRHQVECVDGWARTGFDLVGAGPFVIQVQLVDDPSRTASVPVVGSREQERTATLLSNLGLEYQASLLPGSGSQEIRGLHLNPGGLRSSPVRLERIDAGTIALLARDRLESLCVTLADPSFPGLGVAPTNLPHPQHGDRAYIEAERLLQQSHWEAAHEAFLSEWKGRALEGRDCHPFYAYNLACCCALLQRFEEAVAWIEEYLRAGGKDWDHLRSDRDLDSLRHPDLAPLPVVERFAWLCSGGIRHHRFSLEAGERIELEGLGALTLLALGAFHCNQPWEGQALVVAPSPTCHIQVEASPRPGQTLRVGLSEGAYVVIKDARLASQDTPQSRLASAIKLCAEGHVLKQAEAARSLQELAPPSVATPPTGSSWPFTSPPVRAGVVRSEAQAFLSAPASDGLFGASDPFSAPPPPSGGLRAGLLRKSSPPTGSLRPRLGGEAPLLRRAPQREAQLAPPEPISPAPRPWDPQVLWAGWKEGDFEVELPDHDADYLIEAFFARPREWASCQQRLAVRSELALALEVPPLLWPGDEAWGWVRLAGHKAGEAHVSLSCDDREIELEEVAPRLWSFPVEVGTYRCRAQAGEQVAIRQERVEPLGRLTSLARRTRILGPGQQLSLSDAPGLRSIQVQPSLQQPLKLLVEATHDYQHACCEQTAAKMLSACALWHLGDASQRERAESSLAAGVRRLETMWLPGQGFKMYPSGRLADPYWGPYVPRYLRIVTLLRGRTRIEDSLTRAANLMHDSTQAYRLNWPPDRIESCEDAYWSLFLKRDSGQAQRWLAEFQPPSCHDVSGRMVTAYAAAALLLCGEVGRAVELVNRVTAEFNAQGRLYSTADSAAAIVMLQTLHDSQLGVGTGLIRCGQRTFRPEEIAGKTLQSLEVVAGQVVVSTCEAIEEDWQQLRSNVDVSVALVRQGRPQLRLRPGDQVELVVELREPYKTGDLVWIALPACLSRVFGGGQMKLFSVDFAGAREVRMALAVTSHSGKGHQSLGVCLRNMYDSERVGYPGPLQIASVTAPAGS